VINDRWAGSQIVAGLGFEKVGWWRFQAVLLTGSITWEEQGLAVRYRISAVPTLLVFKGGAVVNTLVGYQDKRRLLEVLMAALDRHAA
jgi:hypothetical protein